MTAFIRRVLDPATGRAFIDDLRPLAIRVAHAGAWNSLAQSVIKVTAPGVPDFYQGTEIWDLSLVDPDNRRPVDYEQRAAMLDRIVPRGVDAALPSPARADLLEGRLDGRIKLYTIARALRARGADPALFHHGAYLPLAPAGVRAAHVFAFARVLQGAAMLTVVPRLTTTMVPDAQTPPVGDVWGDTRVQVPTAVGPTRFVDVFTGERIEADPATRELPVADILRHFPVALLKGD
jgi:(1->4)-alpha-D-glucan 1-alpha-D-glucosylmutase